MRMCPSLLFEYVVTRHMKLFQDKFGDLNNVYIYKYEEHSVHSSYTMCQFEHTIHLIFRLEVT